MYIYVYIYVCIQIFLGLKEIVKYVHVYSSVHIAIFV
jgi:hypothetical protein